MFEVNIGRVVEDYSTDCSECQEGYDSYYCFECKITLSLVFLYVQTRFKFKIRLLTFYLYHFPFLITLLDSECVQTRGVSTYQTSTSQKVKNDADTYESSLYIADTTIGIQTDGNPNGSNYKSINQTQQPR